MASMGRLIYIFLVTEDDKYIPVAEMSFFESTFSWSREDDDDDDDGLRGWTTYSNHSPKSLEPFGRD